MPKHPPHLPPESCSLKAREKVRLIPQVLFVVLISALTGLSISLSIVAWFLPNLGSGYLVKVNNKSSSELIVADPALVKSIKQRLINFYDSAQKPATDFYRDSALLATGAVLSSDGWVVVEGYNLPEKQGQLVGMDYRGQIFTVENRINDEFSGLTYLKIKADGLRVISFANWGDVGEDYNLWSIKDNDWRGIYVDRLKLKEKANEFVIWNSPYNYLLSMESDKGNLLLNSAGELVGFADQENYLIPGWMISEQLSNVLAGKKPVYLGYPYTGYLVQGAGGEGNAAFLGFYVSSAPTRPTTSTIGQGDIIIKINGESLDRANLSRQIIVGNEEMLITFLRDGDEKEMRVKKILVDLK